MPGYPVTLCETPVGPVEALAALGDKGKGRLAIAEFARFADTATMHINPNKPRSAQNSISLFDLTIRSHYSISIITVDKRVFAQPQRSRSGARQS